MEVSVSMRRYDGVDGIGVDVRKSARRTFDFKVYSKSTFKVYLIITNF